MLVIVITVVDLFLPADIHLGPLLVIAPAITASFTGPVLTGAIALLAVAAQTYIGLYFGLLSSRNVVVQIAALAGLSPARWTESSPEALLHHLRGDLLAHAGGQLGDDAAFVAIHRSPIPGPGRHHGDRPP
ncbi:hypothetical protein ACFXPY_40710 [Streptomyces sp. NPDC059153]|uniref:hypothetical protein n=1 Tax=Streptomyces sp. NPDC059153 TaxID=3346743 RepID=UPI003679F269